MKTAPKTVAQKLLILDRDGVINYDHDDYIKSADQWVPLPGAIEAIARANLAGWRVVIASNQSGLGRGLFNTQALSGIHKKMQQVVAQLGGKIDGLFFCPHAPNADCNCRKPKPGLLLQIADHYDVDLTGVPFVGDSLKDIDAALAVHARPLLVRTGKGRQTESALADKQQNKQSIAVFDDLSSAVTALLQEEAGLHKL